MNAGHPGRGLTVHGRNPGVEAEASGPILFCDHRQRDIYSVLSFLQDWKKARIQLPRKEKRIPRAAERREDPPRPIRRVCRCRSDRPASMGCKAHSTAEDSTESPTGWMKGLPVPPALPLPKARPLKYCPEHKFPVIARMSSGLVETFLQLWQGRFCRRTGGMGWSN